MTSNLTPDEIVERRDRVAKLKSEVETDVNAINTHLQAVIDNLAFARDLGIKVIPDLEPKPPDKAERIRECIAKIRLVDDGYDPTDDSATRIECLVMVRRWGFKLIHLLEQDDPNV